MSESDIAFDVWISAHPERNPQDPIGDNRSIWNAACEWQREQDLKAVESVKTDAVVEGDSSKFKYGVESACEMIAASISCQNMRRIKGES